jgi:hypothetical protein
MPDERQIVSVDIKRKFAGVQILPGERIAFKVFNKKTIPPITSPRVDHN